MGRFSPTRLTWGVTLAALLVSTGNSAVAQPRTFTLPMPLFSVDSPWNQKATGATVLPESDQQIRVLHRVLRGDDSTLSFSYPGLLISPWVNSDDFSIPIFAAGPGELEVVLREYEGGPGSTNGKIPANPNGTVTVPTPAGTVRPSAGEGDPLNCDGHLVLVDLTGLQAYDFWQASTALDGQGNSLGGGQPGNVIYQAGAVDRFALGGDGLNPPGFFSARASGAPLLAGLVLPEDVAGGSIDHALALAIPGPRNTNPADPEQQSPNDIFVPAATTEAQQYNTNPLALASGQRLRLKPSLVDTQGVPLDEQRLAPITRMFLRACREYGAYVVDNAGGFIFYAEDIHSAHLQLTPGELNALIGEAPEEPLAAGKSQWQILLDVLNDELQQVPVAYGPWQEGQVPATAEVLVSNWEVVAPFSSAQQLFFAQFGNGDGFTSELVLLNPSPSTRVTGTLELFDDRGQPLATGLSEGGDPSLRSGTAGLRSQVDVVVEPLGAAVFSTDGLGELKVGSAVVTSSGVLGGVIRFSIPGTGITGVGSSPPYSAFLAPVRFQPGRMNTGLALQNTGTAPVGVELKLRDTAGREIATTTIENLAPRGHLARFIGGSGDAFFSGAIQEAFLGTVTAHTTAGEVAAVALELGTSPGEFTTLPVVPLN